MSRIVCTLGALLYLITPVLAAEPSLLLRKLQRDNADPTALIAEFSAPVPPQALKEKLTLSDAEKELTYRINSGAPATLLHLTCPGALDGRALTWSLKRGLNSADRTSAAGEQSGAVPEDPRLHLLSSKAGPEGLLLTFNRPVDYSATRDPSLLTLTPERALTLRPDGTNLWVNAQLPPRTKVTATLAKGFGGAAALDAPLTVELTTPPAEPSLTVREAPFLQPPEDTKVLFEATNVTEVTARVYKLYEENAAHLTTLDAEEIAELGQDLGEKTFQPDLEPDRKTTLRLDLADFDPHPGGLYGLILRGTGGDNPVPPCSTAVLLAPFSLGARSYLYGLHLWTSTPEGGPAPEVNLKVFSVKGLLLAEGQTDHQGLLTVESDRPLTGDRLPAMVTAERDGAFALLSLANSALSADRAEQNEPRTLTPRAQWNLARNRWQPGETLQAWVALRDRDNRALRNQELTLKLTGPSGPVAQKITATDGAGIAELKVTLPDTAFSGTYELEAFQGNALLAGRSLDIGPFVPPLSEARLQAPEYYNGSPLILTGAYLYGAPTAGMAWQAQARFRPSGWRPKGYADWALGNDEPLPEQTVDLGTGTLDSEGRCEIKTEPPFQSKSPLELEYLAYITDDSGRRQEATAVSTLLPHGPLPMVKTDDGRTVKALLSDAEGHSLKGDVTVRLYSTGFDGSGAATQALLYENRLTLDGPTDLNLPEGRGTRKLTVSTEQAETTIMLDDLPRRPFGPEGDDALPVTLRPQPEGAAQAWSFDLPNAAMRVITLGGDRPQFIERLTKAQGTLPPAAERDSWFGAVDTGATDPGLPALEPIPGNRKNESADAEITAEYDNGRAIIGLKARESGGPFEGTALLFVCDAGMGDTGNADPGKTFTALQGPGGLIADSAHTARSQIVPYALTAQTLFTSSDKSAGETVPPAPSAPAPSNRPFTAALKIDVKAGQGQARIETGAFAGGLHIQALLFSERAVGLAQTRLTVLPPLALQPSFPQGAAQGDRINPRVMLISDREGRVTLSYENLKGCSAAEQRLTITVPKGRTTVTLPVLIAGTEPLMSGQIRAENEDRQTLLPFDVALRNPKGMERVTQALPLSSEKKRLIPPPDMQAEKIDLTLLKQDLPTPDDLLGPYGDENSSDELAARLQIQLAKGNTADLDGAESTARNLASRAGYDGLWGRGTDRLGISARALVALAQAVRKGAFDADLLQPHITAASGLASTAPGTDETAQLALGLALAGKNPQGLIKWLGKSNLSPQGQLLLARADLARGETEQALERARHSEPADLTGLALKLTVLGESGADEPERAIVAAALAAKVAELPYGLQSLSPAERGTLAEATAYAPAPTRTSLATLTDDKDNIAVRLTEKSPEEQIEAPAADLAISGEGTLLVSWIGRAAAPKNGQIDVIMPPKCAIGDDATLTVKLSGLQPGCEYRLLLPLPGCGEPTEEPKTDGARGDLHADDGLLSGTITPEKESCTVTLPLRILWSGRFRLAQASVTPGGQFTHPLLSAEGSIVVQ